MDAVTSAVIMLAGIAAIPVTGKIVLNHLSRTKKRRQEKKKQKEKYRMLHDKDYQEKINKKRKLVSDLDKKSNLTFKNAKTGRRVDIAVESKEIEGISTANLDSLMSETIFKGTLRCKCTDGVVRAETIYIYQPKLQTLKGTVIGPRLKDGALNDRTAYAVKLPDGEVVSTYIPRRELISGLNYDFVRGTNTHQNPDIQRYFDIEIPKDEKGNLIPVNLNDPNELKQLKEYVVKHSKHRGGPEGYFGNIYGEALEAAHKFDNERAEPYDITLITGETAKPEVVEKEKEKEQKTDYGYDYYDRYNYHRPSWMGERGTDYAQNVDLADHVFGPDHSGGPRRRH